MTLGHREPEFCLLKVTPTVVTTDVETRRARCSVELLPPGKNGFSPSLLLLPPAFVLLLRSDDFTARQIQQPDSLKFLSAWLAGAVVIINAT